MFKGIAAILITCLAAFSLSANAEQSQTFGDYTIHYNAFTADLLTREVAKSYRIPRSKNRALLNISVLKKTAAASAPVKAEITATATNLNSQLRELKVRELSEHNAIYYIAETTVDHKETLKYELTVTPAGQSRTFSVSFEQQFFTD